MLYAKFPRNIVLLVDDDPHLRDFLSMRLEEAGFDARQAEDGIDGLVKLREALPQVIISDLQMPRMAGSSFYRWCASDFLPYRLSRSREKSLMNFRRQPSPTFGSKRVRLNSANFCKPSMTWFEIHPTALVFRKW